MSFPEGRYIDVYVRDPLTGETLLRKGTGTSSAIGVFACGPFEKSDYPKIGARYKITATRDDPGKKMHEDLFECVATGHQTCDFK